MRTVTITTTLLLAALILAGCAKTTTTTPVTPAPTSPIVAKIELALNLGDAVIQAWPNIPANVKGEVQVGVTQIDTALACVQSVIVANAGGAIETAAAVSCGTAVNVSAFSTQAQQYLSAFAAAWKVVEAYFVPGAPAVTVTVADRTAVKGLAKRTAIQAGKAKGK